MRDQLDRVEALLERIDGNVDDIELSRNSASLNAAVCISTGIGGGLSLGAHGAIGASWHEGPHGELVGFFDAYLNGDSTMAADVCINIPIVSIGKTSIPTSGSKLDKVALFTAGGEAIELTADETQAFEDELVRVADELESMGLAMGGVVGQFWDELNLAADLSPSGNPLKNPQDLFLSMPDVVLSGTVAGTPYASLPLATEAEATLMTIIEDIDPCVLAQTNLKLKEIDYVVELICSDALMSGLNEVVADVNDLPGTINNKFNEVDNKFNDLGNEVNNQFNSVHTALDLGFNSINGAVANSTAVVTNQIDGATTVITSETGAQVAAARQFLETVINIGNGQIRNIINGVRSVVDDIEDVVDPMWALVSDIWDEVDWIVGKIKKILDKLP